MALYTFPRPSISTQRAVNGFHGAPVGVRNEADVFGTSTLLALGIRNESRIDLRQANAGEVLNTSTGDVVSVRTSAGDVLMIDVGNGSLSLQVLGRPGSVSAQALSEANTTVSESAVSLTRAAVESASSATVTPRPTSSLTSEPELVYSQEELAEYSARLGGGGYGQPYGALGASGAATYGDITEQTPIYEPPPADPYYYTPPPAYYEPPPPAPYYEPQPQSYEEWSSVQDQLEQLEVLMQQQYGYTGPGY